MQMGVVDDIAVLAETDLKNKEKIVERKSLYSQLQGQIASMEESMKDQAGTIETLQRQLVQAGIKGKVMQAEMEINRKKEQVKTGVTKEQMKTEAKQDLLREVMQTRAQAGQQRMADQEQLVKARQSDILQNYKKDLESSKENE